MLANAGFASMFGWSTHLLRQRLPLMVLEQLKHLVGCYSLMVKVAENLAQLLGHRFLCMKSQQTRMSAVTSA